MKKIMKKILTHAELNDRCIIMADQMRENYGKPQVKVYPVPRGGIPVAYLLQKHHDGVVIVDSPEEADCCVGDLIDSGATLSRFPNKRFYALYDKRVEKNLGWLVFPWEGNASGSIEDNIIRILQYIGEDPAREGLRETPARVAKSWKELYVGYSQKPEDVFKTFNVGYDELVLMQDIEIYSTCEHHMLPFTGRAHVAYIADGKVIGASKLARLVEVFARRLQVQEQIGTQVVDALMEHLKPKGAACVIEARHLCLAGDSRVQLAYLNIKNYPDGIPIAQLVNKTNIPVYCYSKTTNKLTIGNIKAVWKTGKKKIFKITYEWFLNNQHKKIRHEGSIKVTEDHLMMLKKKARNHYNNKNRKYENGDFLSIKGGLSIGDSLMPFTCTKDEKGYRTLHLNDGKTILEHRFLLEHKLNRSLLFSEVSHHKNENQEDNSYDNLILIKSKGEHSRNHSKGKHNPNKSHSAGNRKERKILTCQNCKSEFTTQYAYMEKTRQFCSHKCYMEARYANHKIISIEEIGIEDVYDLEVDKHHNFAVNDIIVHNCMCARGVGKQHSIMKTSAMRGIFLEDSSKGMAARAELMSLLR